MNLLAICVICAGLVFSMSTRARSDFVTWFEPDAWTQETGPSSAITFTELPGGTWIAHQYEGLGVTFAPPADLVFSGDMETFSDGAGLFGFEAITLDFASPISSFALDCVSVTHLLFYKNENLVWFSDYFAPGPNDPPLFVGFTSTSVFDRVVIYNPVSGTSWITVDNLYFEAIPAPATVMPLFLLVFGRRRRFGVPRRRSTCPARM